MFRYQERNDSHRFQFSYYQCRHTGSLITPDVFNLLDKAGLPVELCYTDTGAMHKPVLVMLHGNSSNKKVIDEQKAYFQDSYRVICLDLLGHGESTHLSHAQGLTADEIEKLTAAFYNPLTMMALIADWLESLNLHHVHMIGWSLGGHFAYGVGVFNPELVSSIVTIGAPPVKFSELGFQKGFNPWFLNTLVPSWVNQPTQYEMREAMDIAHQVGFTEEKDIKACALAMRQTDPLIRRHLFLGLKTYDQDSYYEHSPLDGEHFLLNTSIPVSLFVGQNDAGINPGAYEGMRHQMKHPNSSVRVIEGGAHAVFSSHADAYYEIVQTFLENASNTHTMSLTP